MEEGDDPVVEGSSGEGPGRAEGQVKEEGESYCYGRER